MRPLLLLFCCVAAILALIAGSGSLQAGGLRVIRTGEVEGLIIDSATAQKWGVSVEKSREYWTPSEADVAAAEGRLRAALEKGVKDPATIMPGPFTALSREGSVHEIRQVLERFGKCQRQYVGVVIGGKRFIYLNSFPADIHLQEREHFVQVSDGGASFWRVLYSVETGTFSGLSVNGYA